MAIFHLAVKILSRGKGQSAIAAASYRSGESIKDEIENRIKDCRHGKGGVEYKEILGFSGTREMLWNLAEFTEKRVDAQTAREIEVALPVELTLSQRIELVKEYAKNLIEKYGMACDISLHEPENRKDGGKNYHAHILTTVRKVEGDKLGKKIESLNAFRGGEGLKHIRESWETFVNMALCKANVGTSVSCKSLEAQGVDRIATVHEGHSDSPGLEERRALNEQIKNINFEKEGIINAEGIIRVGIGIQESERESTERLGQAGKGIEEEIGRIEREVSEGAESVANGISKSISGIKYFILEKIGRITNQIQSVLKGDRENIESTWRNPRKLTADNARKKVSGDIYVPGMSAKAPEPSGKDLFCRLTVDRTKAAFYRRDLKQHELFKSRFNAVSKHFKRTFTRKPVWSRSFKRAMSFNEFLRRKEDENGSIRI